MSIETENDEIDIEIQTLEAIYENRIDISVENDKFVVYKMTVDPIRGVAGCNSCNSCKED